jgi:hypothetical protein
MSTELEVQDKRSAPTGMELNPQPTTRQLIQQMLASGGNPVELAPVIKELVGLLQSEERFQWEREERQAKIDFDRALTHCQEQIGRIAPNRTRENGIMWADYAELDRVLRPIYTVEGFAIAYSESEVLREGKVLICATLSRGGESRQYFQSATPAGNSKMSAADMEASGQSRAQRYLLLKIFNVAIGIDAIEKEPYKQDQYMDQGSVADFQSLIEGSANVDDLQRNYFAARDAAESVEDAQAGKRFAEVKNKVYRQLSKGKADA